MTIVFLPPAVPIISALLHLVIDLRLALAELKFEDEELIFTFSKGSLLRVEFANLYPPEDFAADILLMSLTLAAFEEP
jgi:hypothetical protein